MPPPQDGHLMPQADQLELRGGGAAKQLSFLRVQDTMGRAGGEGVAPSAL